MKIDLDEPFSHFYRFGYLDVNSENRRTVMLYNSNQDRVRLSYARYLMCVKLGYILPSEFEVDHIDDDKTNDHIDNLQVLTKEQNLLKHHYKYIMFEQVSYGAECANCGLRFLLTDRLLNMRLAQNVEYAFCSRSCGSRFHSDNNSNCISDSKTIEEINYIKQLRQQGLSSYKISDATGYARNTVMKYW